MITKVKSLLEQLEEHVNVDADTYDSDFIRTMPFTPHDATSNQGFIHAAIIDPRNREIVEGVIKDLDGESWEAVYAVCVARIAKNVIPVISGRVLAQVSTNYAYDKAKVVEHARRYAKAFNDVGITNDRFCIKIPVTSAGVQAAIELGADGIATLGTTLFSVPQAIAAAQAGMHAVSMYLNEPRAHAEAGVWPDVADPATQAPMAARHVQIRAAYDERAAQGHKVPQMKTASFCVAPDVLAAAELGADHVTVGIPVLTDLMEYSTMPEYRPGMWKVPFKVQAEDQEREWVAWQPRSVSDPEIQALRKSDPLAKSPECKVATFDTDYTVGDVLDKANDEDPATQFRLQFAIKRFADMEAQSKKFLDGLMAA